MIAVMNQDIDHFNHIKIIKGIDKIITILYNEFGRGWRKGDAGFYVFPVRNTQGVLNGNQSSQGQPVKRRYPVKRRISG